MASYEGGFAIGRLKEIKPVTPSDASADAAQMSRELTLAVAQDLLSQYTAALRRTYPVTINRAAVDSIQ